MPKRKQSSSKLGGVITSKGPVSYKPKDLCGMAPSAAEQFKPSEKTPIALHKQMAGMK